jgi:hypothetical protein
MALIRSSGAVSAAYCVQVAPSVRVGTEHLQKGQVPNATAPKAVMHSVGIPSSVAVSQTPALGIERSFRACDLMELLSLVDSAQRSILTGLTS